MVWGEMSEAGHVETKYPEQLSFSNLQNFNSNITSFGPRRTIKTLNNLSAPLARTSANRKRERSGDRGRAEDIMKKWKV